MSAYPYNISQQGINPALISNSRQTVNPAQLLQNPAQPTASPTAMLNGAAAGINPAMLNQGHLQFSNMMNMGQDLHMQSKALAAQRQLGVQHNMVYGNQQQQQQYYNPSAMAPPQQVTPRPTAAMPMNMPQIPPRPPTAGSSRPSTALGQHSQVQNPTGVYPQSQQQQQQPSRPPSRPPTAGSNHGGPNSFTMPQTPQQTQQSPRMGMVNGFNASGQQQYAYHQQQQQQQQQQGHHQPHHSSPTPSNSSHIPQHPQTPNPNNHPGPVQIGSPHMGTKRKFPDSAGGGSSVSGSPQLQQGMSQYVQQQQMAHTPRMSNASLPSGGLGGGMKTGVNPNQLGLGGMMPRTNMQQRQLEAYQQQQQQHASQQQQQAQQQQQQQQGRSTPSLGQQQQSQSQTPQQHTPTSSSFTPTQLTSIGALGGANGVVPDGSGMLGMNGAGGMGGVQMMNNMNLAGMGGMANMGMMGGMGSLSAHQQHQQHQFQQLQQQQQQQQQQHGFTQHPGGQMQQLQGQQQGQQLQQHQAQQMNAPTPTSATSSAGGPLHGMNAGMGAGGYGGRTGLTPTPSPMQQQQHQQPSQAQMMQHALAMREQKLAAGMMQSQAHQAPTTTTQNQQQQHHQQQMMQALQAQSQMGGLNQLQMAASRGVGGVVGMGVPSGMNASNIGVGGMGGQHVPNTGLVSGGQPTQSQQQQQQQNLNLIAQQQLGALQQQNPFELNASQQPGANPSLSHMAQAQLGHLGQAQLNSLAAAGLGHHQAHALQNAQQQQQQQQNSMIQLQQQQQRQQQHAQQQQLTAQLSQQNLQNQHQQQQQQILAAMSANMGMGAGGVGLSNPLGMGNITGLGGMGLGVGGISQAQIAAAGGAGGGMGLGMGVGVGNMGVGTSGMVAAPQASPATATGVGMRHDLGAAPGAMGGVGLSGMGGMNPASAGSPMRPGSGMSVGGMKPLTQQPTVILSTASVGGMGTATPTPSMSAVPAASGLLQQPTIPALAGVPSGTPTMLNPTASVVVSGATPPTGVPQTSAQNQPAGPPAPRKPAQPVVPTGPNAGLVISAASLSGITSAVQTSGPPAVQTAAMLPPGVKVSLAMTRVTPIPLSNASNQIPEIPEEEAEKVKGWIERDVAYEKMFRTMKDRSKAELQSVFGRPKWWERDLERDAALDARRAASGLPVGKKQFELVYPKRDLSAFSAQAAKERERGRVKVIKREGLRLPRKLKKEEEDLVEQLVPIRLEFDVEHCRYRDTFVWNLNDPVVTPEAFAQSVVEDYSLPQMYHTIITKSIQEQLSDYKTHCGLFPEGEEVTEVPAAGTFGLVGLDGIAVVERGRLEGDDLQWWESWRKKLRTKNGHVRMKGGKSEKSKCIGGVAVGAEMSTSVHGKKKKRGTSAGAGKTDSGAVDVNEIEVDEERMHEEMRILIKVDITVGSMKLDDQFEWDIENVDVTPEQFADVYGSDLGLPGEFKTAIAHAIREQVQAYQKSLFLVGHPLDGTAIQDEDLRMSFLPTVASAARPVDQTQPYTPQLHYLSDGELDRLDKEREKELTKRRKRNTRGRRGIALPDREPIKTHRTPAIGFPEVDPSTLAMAMAVNAPTSRRAAAAAASVNIANMVASENGTPLVMQPTISQQPQAPPPIISKVPKAKGSFKAPPIPQSAYKTRSKANMPIASTAADSSTFAPPLEGDLPLPPSTPHNHAGSSSHANASAASAIADAKANKAISAKRQRELEKEAKEKEFADGQHANMINGVWHCSNCGCPDSVAIGRRKGPLGDKSQCGACGKFWHRHRRPRPVEYHADAEYHINIKLEAERAKTPAKKRAKVQAQQERERDKERDRDSSVPPARDRDRDDGPPHPPKHEVWIEVKTRKLDRNSHVGNGSDVEMDSVPPRPVSPASTVSSSASDERPLAQATQINGISHNTRSVSQRPAVTPARSSNADDDGATSTSNHNNHTPAANSHPNVANLTNNSPSVEPSASGGTPPTANPPKPQWLVDAMAEMQAKYPDDRFEIIIRKSNPPEWRVKCLDCPGKLYTPGPGETLNNYEVHLKNRQHRARVLGRVSGAS